VTLGACAPSSNPRAAEFGKGFAFGSFKVIDGDITVTHVVLMRVRPTKLYMGGSGERSTLTYGSGDFYSANLDPGTYALNAVYSGGQSIALASGLSGNLFEVKGDSATYCGSYEMNYRKPGMLSSEAGSYRRVDSPQAELRLLTWLMQDLGSSSWVPILRRRFNELTSGRAAA
jgi:hypothetical protein